MRLFTNYHIGLRYTYVYTTIDEYKCHRGELYLGILCNKNTKNVKKSIDRNFAKEVSILLGKTIDVDDIETIRIKNNYECFR